MQQDPGTSDALARVHAREAKVAVIGQGYVGLVVAMRASEAGFPVVGLERDQTRAHRLAAGRSHIEDARTTSSEPHSTAATCRLPTRRTPPTSRSR